MTAPMRSISLSPSTTWIPVALVSDLLGVSRFTIYKRVEYDEWEHRYVSGDGGGREMHIALSALPADLQIRAIQALHRESASGKLALSAGHAQITGTDHDRASATEKAEADRRLALLTQWRAFLGAQAAAGSGQRSAHTKTFLRTVRAQGERVSKSSLYTWDAAYTARGLDGLLPRYSAGGRPTSLDPSDRSLFLQCWGQEQQPTLATAYRAFLIVRKREHEANPDDPRFLGQPASFGACRYLINHLSPAERILMRQGPKAVRAQLLPYIERDWEGCLPLEWFVMDHSPLDILALDDDGRLCRPYLTALMDMGTRRVCVTVCRTPNQNTVLWTLAKAILAWGTPGNLYVDNGKDFRAASVTGGKKKAVALNLNEDRCRSRCDQLGIQAHFAINFNAQAKPIERWFRTLEQNVAVLFETYVGNRPDKKPEALKDNLKAGDLPTFRDVERIVTGWIEGVYHQTAHTGRGMGGKSPNAVWAERIHQVSIVTRTRDELRYLLLKTQKTVTVARYQIRLFGRSYEAAAETPDCLYGYHGQQVVPHYDPRDITRVFLTLEDETPVGWVVEKRLAAIGPAGEDVIAASKREQKKVRAALRTHLADLSASRVEPDRVIRQARAAQALADGRAPLGSLAPHVPVGKPKTATVVALNPKLRAAAAMAAAPPTMDHRPPTTDGDALSDLISDGEAIVNRQSSIVTPPSDDWLADLIQEGTR